MSSLELKIPPPVAALVTAVAMALLAGVAAPVAMPLSVRVALATVLALLGVAVSGSGVAAFHAAKTTRNPLNPQAASTLVRAGPYVFTRNPMYLGMLLLLLAWAAALASLPALAGPVVFALYIGRFQIEPEERALAARFGAEYLAYRQRVRRWL